MVGPEGARDTCPAACRGARVGGGAPDRGRRRAANTDTIVDRVGHRRRGLGRPPAGEPEQTRSHARHGGSKGRRDIMATGAQTSTRGSTANGGGPAGSNGGPGEPRAGRRSAREAIASELQGDRPRTFPGFATAKLVARLVIRPQAVARRGLGLAAEVGRVAVGASELEPEKGDRRFKDKGWKLNPAFRRLLQLYLATGQTVDEVIEDAELDWRSEQRVRFAASNLLDALAPTNFPLTNPTVLKA